MGRAVSASISARVMDCYVLRIACCVFEGWRCPGARLAHNTQHATRNTALVLAALLLAALPLRAQPAVDLFQLLDGSSLHGALETIDPAKGIRWKHPAATTPIEFLARNAYQIRFAQVAPPPAQAGTHHTCRFRFVNGDELTGNLLSLDAQHIELETWFAGKVRAPRASVQSLAFLAKGFATIYEGPASLEGWATGPTPTAWQLRDGVLTGAANAFMGRDLKLPPQARLEFEIGSAVGGQFYVSLYTDSTQHFNFAASGYQFQFSPNFVSLMRGQGQFGMQHLGQAQIPVPLPGRTLRFEIRADLLAGMITLLVDGNVIQQWNDPTVTKPIVPVVDPNLPPTVADAVRDAAKARGPQPGTGLSFFMMNGGVQLSAIKVSAWDGRPIEPDVLATNFTGHLVRLANQDRATGEVRAVRDGKLTLASAAGSLDIPLARVTQVILAPAAPTGTNRPAGEVHARLSSGETVALTQPRWDGRQLAGVSVHFGPLQLDTRWVRMLRFNPGREPAELELPLLGSGLQQFFER